MGSRRVEVVNGGQRNPNRTSALQTICNAVNTSKTD